MNNIYDYTLEQLEEKLVELGGKKFNATQIFEWLYKKNINSLDEISNISKNFKEKLINYFTIKELIVINRSVSSDGTVKYLFQLNEGEYIETVLMKQPYGFSVCVTTQLGCNMGCKFCASGLLKKQRDLTAGEIVAQVITIAKLEDLRISHVVIMGIGEPFDNYDNVMDFIKIINNPKGLEIGARHITVSTSGLVDGIERFSKENLQVNLAVSLHAPNNELRAQIMPVNKKYDINKLFKGINDYINITNRRVTFEYILLKGINDSLEQAEELANLVHGMNCYINLIPYNGVEENEFKRTTSEQANKFFDYLKKRKLNVVLRREQGSDIAAACGQLRSKQIKRGV